jgi:transmembrane sensor
MESEKFINYQTTEDFILDKEFIHCVLHPDKELDRFWELFIQEHPEKETQIRDAALLIKSLQPLGQEVPQQTLDEILQNIKISNNRKKLNWFTYLKYAAGIAVFIAISSLIFRSVYMKNQFSEEVSSETDLKGKVILSDGSTKEFTTEQTAITQTTTGNLVVNHDTIKVNTNKISTELNRIIVPYGKRSDVRLADGTHILLNSGSQLSYPTEFKTDSREVYLSGEAFFEVKANPDKPFYVITRDVKIKVMGTSFNVSSYNEDITVQTVLLKGKVTAGKNKLFAGTIDLVPGERLTYDKNTLNLSKDEVDVQLYSSWVKGYLIFANRPIKEISLKLKRYYNQDIAIEDGLENITFSGKLELKDNLKDILENIAFASSLNVQENNGSFIIKK